MRHRHRLDANHGEIREACEALGWLFEDTSQTGLGYDAILTKAGRTLRLEIKDGSRKPSEQRLTPNEAKKHATLKRYGVDVLLVTGLGDLNQLDREARDRHEG